MEYELLYGKRQNKKKEPQLLYIPNERCLYVQNNQRNGKREYQCYQRVLCANKKKIEPSQATCTARVFIDSSNTLMRNGKQHSAHADHSKIVSDIRAANRIKDVCASAGNNLPTHKVSTKQIFYTEIAR